MSYEIKDHPVLDFPKKREVKFFFNDKELIGIEGDPIIVSLRKNGVIKLKEGAKNHTPYGPFCMQGRCCSCAMNVNNKPNVMTCVTPLEEGMQVRMMGDERDTEVFKRLPSKRIDVSPSALSQNHPTCDLAIIGAGPAGMEAAIMAAQAGVGSVVLFDDKNFLGGQLTLQTHTFFGNQELGASMRGYEISRQMKKEIENLSIDVRLGSTVVGLYPGNMLGFRDEDKLNFIVAKKIIVATGASEKYLPFEGNSLPGVMGAGGAQSFMNIYGVKPGKRALIVGGGNIGVILAYQMIQAGVEVAALVEASPKMGAYNVHIKKLQALGIPTFTSHTIKRAHGKDAVTGATIVALDSNWKEVEGSEKYYDVDTICLAVGLSPLNELLWQAGLEFELIPELGEVPLFDKFRQSTNRDIFIAGDCAVIGEASIARLEGRIAGLKAALDLGKPHPEFNHKMDEAFKLLDNIQTGTLGQKLGSGKSKVTKTPEKASFIPKEFTQKLTPESFKGNEKRIIIDCKQDIPCNPCEASCHFGAIKIGNQLTQQPSVELDLCKGCAACLPACPGRAIRLIQYNYDDKFSAITIPYEFHPYPEVGEEREIRNQAGSVITKGKILSVRKSKDKTGCGTITFSVEKTFAFDSFTLDVLPHVYSPQKEDCHKGNKTYVCRCEEVTFDDINALIQQGHTSANDIKRLKRVGMGQCRGQSCSGIVENLIKKEAKLTPVQILETKKNRRSMFRPPIKRITLGEAAKLKFTKEEVQLFESIEHVRTIPQEIVNTYVEENPATTDKLKKKYVIIGGGAAGVFTAWWLSKLGASDIVVLESNFLTSGQTGACLGGIRTGFNTANKVARAKKGLQMFKDAKELIGQDVGWHEGGYVYLAFDEKQDRLFKDSFQTWDKGQVPFTYITDKNLFDKYVPGVDDQKIESLVHFPEAGGANPFRAIFMFAEDAKKRGVTFLTNHEVVRINKNANDAIESVVAFDKLGKRYIEIKTENVVNAAGTGSVRVAKMAGVDLSDQLWIERHGAFITEKMPLWLDPLIVSYHPELSGYWQQKRMEAGVKEGEMVACYSSSKTIKGFNTHSYIYFLSRMAKAMLLCQPGMADVGIIRNYAEHYVCRQSGIPIVGKTPVKGFWLNVAQAGHGFMCAPGDSFALAETIISGKTHEWITECTIEEDKSLAETMK